MARILVKNLTPGMKLERPVLNKNGLVMLGQNTELTSSLIDKIRDMEVSSVYVQGGARNLPPKQELLGRLHDRFKNVENMPYMGVLKRLLIEHIEGLYEDHGSENGKGQG
ncbi:MAG: hypothetical protein A4E57_00462 [Syntrophorhabdaceae bacterium PtaU1.Bin034]|jgi:hypothetical protein|nr:MAG: hypothetical protein A4E57_00462 [Syntrophorhabdaceae bacterium PtaU1.Bin034]